MEVLFEPWPWYVSGPLIGFMVPALLWAGNKKFGISANFRHLCAACLPGNISFFQYNWKAERWNLVFALGVILGGFLATWLSSTAAVQVSPELLAQLEPSGISSTNGWIPEQLFNFSSLLSARGVIMMVFGGFLVGFGTRYAGGCTSGHSISGISALQPASLIATCCFMAGGIATSNLILPYILSL